MVQDNSGRTLTRLTLAALGHQYRDVPTVVGERKHHIMPPTIKFPPISTTVENVQRTAVERVRRRFIPTKASLAPTENPSLEAVVQSAWGLLVSLYLDEENITIASGVVPHSTTETHPLLFRVPFVIRCDTCTRHMCRIAAEYTETAIRQGRPEAIDSFPNSVLLAVPDVGSADLTSGGWPPCALLLLYSHKDDLLSIDAHFDPRVLPYHKARRMLAQICHIATQIATEPAAVVGNMNLLGEADRTELEAWNSGDEAACDASITQLISAHLTSRPDAQALSAHDGSMTYAQLDFHTHRLAAHLIQLGLAQGDYVPLLFEKSIWCLVAMIAVLRAGAAFAPLSPEYPQNRMEFICTQINARMALASASLAPVMDPIVGGTVAISRDTMMHLSPDHSVTLPVHDPNAVAYIMHTSGSTGLPKGAMLEHGSIVASARNIISQTSMNPTTRTLHFSNYIFGAAMAEIWSALIVGGCLCIPSEEQRLSSLDTFVIEHRVSWACMTPSLARMHSPSTMSGLSTLVIGGEAMTSDVLQCWAPFVKLYNVYGSAEQSHIISIDGPMEANGSGASIGRMFSGSYAWVVMPQNVNQLVPLGCVGELITEGPQIARGYLQEPDRTSTSFPRAFPWRDQFPTYASGGPTRFYRTGDIVRYTTAGRLEYLSRREGYVKINGQRVELGEIEYQVRSVVPEAYRVCVELGAPGGKSAEDAVLVVFITTGDDRAAADQELYRTIHAHLLGVLPPFMIPRYYYPLRKMPATISGKTARSELRRLVASLSAEQLFHLSVGRSGQRQIDSHAEKYMRKTWAAVLNISESAIQADDTFFDLGGDSRKAVKLYRVLQRDGHDISVRQILMEPILSVMAGKCTMSLCTQDS